VNLTIAYAQFQDLRFLAIQAKQVKNLLQGNINGELGAKVFLLPPPPPPFQQEQNIFVDVVTIYYPSAIASQENAKYLRYKKSSGLVKPLHKDEIQILQFYMYYI
jgi:hypothetical protein